MTQKNTIAKDMPQELVEYLEAQKRLEENQRELKKFERIQKVSSLTPKQDKEYNALQKEIENIKDEMKDLKETLKTSGVEIPNNSLGNKISQSFSNMFKTDKEKDNAHTTEKNVETINEKQQKELLTSQAKDALKAFEKETKREISNMFKISKYEAKDLQNVKNWVETTKQKFSDDLDGKLAKAIKDFPNTTEIEKKISDELSKDMKATYNKVLDNEYNKLERKLKTAEEKSISKASDKVSQAKDMPNELTQIQAKADKQALDEINEAQKKLEETQAQLKKFERIQKVGSLTPKQDKEYNALRKEATALQNEINKIYEVSGLKPEENSIGKAFNKVSDKVSQSFDNIFKNDKTSNKAETKAAKNNKTSEKLVAENDASEAIIKLSNDLKNVVVKPVESIANGIKRFFGDDKKETAEQTKKSSIPPFSDIVSQKSDTKSNESYNSRESIVLTTYNKELESLQKGGDTMSANTTELANVDKDTNRNIARQR